MNGISHSWNGTVLTITSDSGTSSCDLKGEKGDDGVRGAQGIPGERGNSVSTDATLSVSGQAADAKVTGDKINALQPIGQLISGSTKPVTSGAAYDLKTQIDTLKTNLTENYIPAVAKYYGVTTNKSADDLTDGMALIPISTEVNTELHNILSGTFAYVMTVFFEDNTTENRRTQIAFSYNSIPSSMAIRTYSSSGWIAWNRIITQAELPTMQSGTQTFTIAAGEEAQVKITFPTAFKNVPFISLEYKQYGSWLRISNTSVNRYGITFNAKNTYTGELTFSILWQAMGV